jgi:hypothetical protein
VTDVLAGVSIETDTVSRTLCRRPRQRNPAPDKGDRLRWAKSNAPRAMSSLNDDKFQHSELLKITTSAVRGHKGVSRVPERKTPVVRSVGTNRGSRVILGRCLVCIQVTSRKCPLEVTSSHSLSSKFRVGNRMWLWRVHGFLRPTRAISDRQTHTQRRTPDWYSLRATLICVIAVRKSFSSRLKNGWRNGAVISVAVYCSQ